MAKQTYYLDPRFADEATKQKLKFTGFRDPLFFYTFNSKVKDSRNSHGLCNNWTEANRKDKSVLCIEKPPQSSTSGTYLSCGNATLHLPLHSLHKRACEYDTQIICLYCILTYILNNEYECFYILPNKQTSKPSARWQMMKLHAN